VPVSAESQDQEGPSPTPDSSPEAPGEVLEGELEEKAERVATRAVEIAAIHIAAEWFAGPLPHPKHLEEYERVLPGSAERVFSMAEREQAHRHGVEDRAMNIEESLGKRGQVFGLIIVLAAFGISLWLGLADHEIAAAVIGGAGLTTLVGLFLKRHRPESVSQETIPPVPPESKGLEPGKSQQATDVAPPG